MGQPGPGFRKIGEPPGNVRAARPGPFDIEADGDSPYKILWAHNCEAERQLIVRPDRIGHPRPGHEDRARKMWKDAVRLHVSRDFRVNAQSLSACVTPGPCIGGVAWPSYVLGNRAHEKIVALWFNSTLGLMAHWWAGSRQQRGRSRLTMSRLGELIVLDARTLSDTSLAQADAIFDQLAEKRLLPANEAYRDPVRAQLDRAVLCDVLGLPEDVLVPLDAVRLAWCKEPTVHGGKRTRPQLNQK